MPRIRRPSVDPTLFDKAADVGARLTCAACGSAPILMLSTAYAKFAPLSRLLVFVVLPAYGVILLLGMLLPEVGRAAGTGFLGGIVAVLAYDLTRLALSYSQGGSDPIPHIGIMLMGDGTPWWVGYLWRTLGNGAGLGVVFAVLVPRSWWGPKLGLVYASMIGLGMLGFLSLFPVAQTQLFKVSWQTMVNSSLGHATYGLVLGVMCRAYARRQARRPVRHGRHAAGLSPGAAGTGAPPGPPAGKGYAPDGRMRIPEGGPLGGCTAPGWAVTEPLPVQPGEPPSGPGGHPRGRGSHARP
jgi:hypothetical protein